MGVTATGSSPTSLDGRGLCSAREPVSERPMPITSTSITGNHALLLMAQGLTRTHRVLLFGIR
eukprot:4776858-Lingulodinium_polyedra.AAC.1